MIARTEKIPPKQHTFAERQASPKCAANSDENDDATGYLNTVANQHESFSINRGASHYSLCSRFASVVCANSAQDQPTDEQNDHFVRAAALEAAVRNNTAESIVHQRTDGCWE